MKKRIYLHLLLVGVVCILLTALVCAFAYWQTSKQETGYYLEQTASVLGSELTRQETPWNFWTIPAKPVRIYGLPGWRKTAGSCTIP